MTALMLAIFGALLAQEPVRIQDWGESQRRFRAWQEKILAEHIKPTEELRRLARHKVVVPPLPPSEEADRYPFRMPFPNFFGAFPGLEIQMGAPTVELTVGAEGELAKFLAYKHKIGVAYGGADPRWAFVDAVEARAAYSKIPNAEITGMYQMFGHEIDKIDAGGNLTMTTGRWSAGVGLTPSGDFSAGGGASILPTGKIQVGKFASVDARVDLTVSAPIRVTHVQYGSGYGLAQLSTRAAAAIERMIARPVPCTYCEGRLTIPCRRCAEQRSLVCGTCKGAKTAACGTCEGGGQLTCSPTESCGACGGGGKSRCSTCGGSGSVTRYETVTKTRQVRVLLEAGFDETGQPFEKWGWKTEEYQEQESRSVTCGSCGGSGSAGACGTCSGSGRVSCRRCGGNGTVACGSCAGSGRVSCGTCSGSGRLRCPTCGGKAVSCPLCNGRGKLGR